MNVTPDRLVEFVGNHWIMTSGFVIVLFLLIQDFLDSLRRKHKLISPEQAVILLNDEATVILDVREASEFAKGHIEQARHVPAGKVAERANDLQADKTSNIIVYCESGTRSPQACRKLTELGFPNIFELRGGLLAWEDRNLPITKKRNKK